MPRRTGTRRFGKWAATVLALALAAGFVFTFFQTVSYYPWSGKQCHLTSGALLRGYRNGISPLGGPYLARPTHRPFTWLPHYDTSAMDYWWVCPLWPIPLGAGLVAVWLWRLDRFPRGHCRRCGYDLTGLAAGAVCPECGAASQGVAGSQGA